MRLICADKLQDNVRDVYGGNGENTVIWYGDVLLLVDEQPTIDPSSLVKRGRWEHTNTTTSYFSECLKCSECGFEDTEMYLFKHCPDCGALMED